MAIYALSGGFGQGKGFGSHSGRKAASEFGAITTPLDRRIIKLFKAMFRGKLKN